MLGREWRRAWRQRECWIFSFFFFVTKRVDQKGDNSPNKKCGAHIGLEGGKGDVCQMQKTQKKGGRGGEEWNAAKKNLRPFFSVGRG